MSGFLCWQDCNRAHSWGPLDPDYWKCLSNCEKCGKTDCSTPPPNVQCPSNDTDIAAQCQIDSCQLRGASAFANLGWFDPTYSNPSMLGITNQLITTHCATTADTTVAIENNKFTAFNNWFTTNTDYSKLNASNKQCVIDQTWQLWQAGFGDDDSAPDVLNEIYTNCKKCPDWYVDKSKCDHRIKPTPFVKCPENSVRFGGECYGAPCKIVKNGKLETLVCENVTCKFVNGKMVCTGPGPNPEPPTPTPPIITPSPLYPPINPGPPVDPTEWVILWDDFAALLAEWHSTPKWFGFGVELSGAIFLYTGSYKQLGITFAVATFTPAIWYEYRIYLQWLRAYIKWFAETYWWVSYLEYPSIVMLTGSIATVALMYEEQNIGFPDSVQGDTFLAGLAITGIATAIVAIAQTDIGKGFIKVLKGIDWIFSV